MDVITVGLLIIGVAALVAFALMAFCDLTR
jgi:hypothetical protein